MKKTLTFAVFLGFLALYVPGPAAQDLFVSERAPDQRTIQRTNRIVLANGRVLDRFEGYTEIGSGLYYRHQAEEELRESREQLELFENGAIAREGPCRVIFSPDAATPGALDLQTPFPEQHRLRCHV